MSKHDPLTEVDMSRFAMHPAILGLIHAQAREYRKPLRVLDWGCGRGRAVALLRQERIEAYGVDVDRAVLLNGHDLFRARGLNPGQLLLHTDDTAELDDGAFDLVFSEETLEHVADLTALAHESFRLIRPGGMALHSFPGSRWLMEPHVRMPFVHWLPDGRGRRLLMLLCLLLGFGPRPSWPEVRGVGLEGRLTVFSRYLAGKTHYRPRGQVMGIFIGAGFDGRWLGAPEAGWRRLLPAGLRDNGFPSGHLLLLLTKPGRATATKS